LLRLGYRLNPIPASLGGWLAIASGVGLVLSRISWTSYIWLLPDLRFWLSVSQGDLDDPGRQAPAVRKEGYVPQRVRAKPSSRW
jgi:hypothetical protein